MSSVLLTASAVMRTPGRMDPCCPPPPPPNAPPPRPAPAPGLTAPRPAAPHCPPAEPGPGPRTARPAAEGAAAARHDFIGAAALRGDRGTGGPAAQARIRRRSAGLRARSANAQTSLLEDIARAGR